MKASKFFTVFEQPITNWERKVRYCISWERCYISQVRQHNVCSYKTDTSRSQSQLLLVSEMLDLVQKVQTAWMCVLLYFPNPT
jgi:recombinational DNA repair protein RecR